MVRYVVELLGRRARAASLVALSTALVAAALTAHGAARSSLAAQNDGGVLVGFVNGLPDAPVVAVSVDGVAVVDELAYGQVTDGMQVDAGLRRVMVSEAGPGGATLVESELDLLAGAAYVVSAYPLEEGEPTLARWRVDRSPAETDRSRLQLIHLSPDTPSVDVAVEGGDVLLAGVGFTDPPQPVEVAAGTYNLEMRPAGSTDVVQRVPDVTVEAGTVYCVFGLGLLGDDGSLDIVTFAAPLNEATLAASGVGSAAAASARAAWPVWALGAAALGAALVALRGWRSPMLHPLPPRPDARRR